MPEAPSPAPLSDEAVTGFLTGLWRLNRTLKQEVRPLLQARGLDLRRYIILVSVQKGVAYPKRLSEELDIPPTLLSRYLDSLSTAGYLERHIDPQDSRRTRLSLTAPGEEAVQGARRQIRESTGRRLHRLDPALTRALLEALDTLGNSEPALETV